MSERAVPVLPEARERQRAVLTQLMEASGLKLTPAAASIGVSASQLSRYLSGATILPTPTYEAVARTFGIPRDGLARQLLGLAPEWKPDATDDPDWDFLAELQRLWPDDPEAVERTYHGLANAPLDIQRSVISEIEKALRDEQPRADPEERADYRCGVAG